MGDWSNTVAAELMGRYSNLVLVQDGRIIDALKRVDFEDSEVRQLLPGLPYTLPPKPARPDFLVTSAAAMVALPARRTCPSPRPWARPWRCRPCCRAGGRLPRALGETPALACTLTVD